MQRWLQAAGAEADERPLAELKKPGFKVSKFQGLKVRAKASTRAEFPPTIPGGGVQPPALRIFHATRGVAVFFILCQS